MSVVDQTHPADNAPACGLHDGRALSKPGTLA
jgi:hypothetical protein